jgi:superoxide dismutase, Cu-Zn family
MRPIMTASGALLCSLLVGTAEARSAKAELRDAAGQKVGEATLDQTRDGVRIVATFTGLPPGPHGFHIHEVGKCEAPFEAAGGHFNPTGKQHGLQNPAGPHAGDLPNIQVPANGRVRIEAVAKGVRLDGKSANLLDGDGAALVVHAAADDYTSDPAGNSGERIACGVIQKQ